MADRAPTGRRSALSAPGTADTHASSRRLTATIVGSIAFVVYARTLLPGIAFGDWGEMQTVPHVLGVAHPTGYPTYIILGWLAQLLPIASVAYRANLLSALAMALTLAVASLIMTRLGVRPVLAIAGALALGAVGTVWAAATVAEVNALHLLFVALLLHRALVWEARRAPRDLLIGGLLIGLGLGNHLLTAFVAPFVVVFVVWVGRREIARRPWILLLAAAGGLLGLAVYLYIPIAAMQDPPLAYNHPVTLEKVAWLVDGTQFRDQFDFLTGAGPTELAGSIPSLWASLVSRGTIVLPALGLLGLVVLVWQRRAFGLCLLGIGATGVYLWANYLRLEHYLLTPWLILGITAAYAMESFARTVAGAAEIAGVRDARWSRVGGILVAALAVVFAIGLAATNWGASDRSGEHGGDAYVETMLGSLPPDAAILTPWDASAPLWHAQFVLGQRPDVLVVDDTNIVYEGWGTRERRIASLICDRPVFIVRLKDSELDPTRSGYRLDPFIDVRVGEGGPTATATRTVMRVTPLDLGACPG